MSGSWQGFTSSFDAPPPAAAQPAPAAAGSWQGFTSSFDPAQAAPAAPVTPAVSAPQSVIRAKGANLPSSPLTPTQQIESDVPTQVAQAGLSLGKTGLGILQATIGSPPDASTPMPWHLTAQDRAARAAIQPAANNARTSLNEAQQMLSDEDQKLQSTLTPATQAAQSASWNPNAPNNVFQHGFIQTALAKGPRPATELLATIMPAALAGKAAAAIFALTNAGMGAGSTMSAVSDTVNQQQDSWLKANVPTYAVLRQKMSQAAAKAQLVTKLGESQALWSGAVSALLGDVGGQKLAGVMGLTAQKLIPRTLLGAGEVGAAMGVQGGASDLAVQQATQPVTQKPTDWKEVLDQSIIAGLQGVGFGGVTSALMRHMPETMAAGTSAHVNSPEGAAVNHATHADVSTTPGAPMPEPEKPGPEIDYDNVHGEGDEEDEAEKPAAKPAPVEPDLQAAVDATATASPAKAVPAPVEGTLSLAKAPAPKEAPVEGGAGLPAQTGPKPFIMPEEPFANRAVQEQNSARVTLATGIVKRTAQRLIKNNPAAAKADTDVIDSIMADLERQARVEMSNFKGTPPEMAAQFAAAKPIRDRIAEAVISHAKTPEIEDESYAPEAKDASEAPTGRVRDGSLFKPGNEGALLAKIHPDEKNQTTYQRAHSMIAERGDEAHSVYHDMLALKDNNLLSGRDKKLLMGRYRSTEQAYLQAEARSSAEKRPPTEHQILASEQPATNESDQAFWARIQRATDRAKEAGTFIKRGSFLNRAGKALDKAKDEYDARDDRGRGAIPSRAVTEQLKGKEFLARHGDELGETKDTDPLTNQSIYNDDGSIRHDAEDGSLYMKRGASTLPKIAARARAGKASRGAEAMTNRLRMERGLGKNTDIDPEDIRDVENFLSFLGPHLTKGTALSIRASKEAPGVHGSFDFRTKIATIYKAAINSGNLTRTAIHELWHAVETAIKLPDKIALRREYARNYAKYLTKNPWMESFGTAHPDGTRGLSDQLVGRKASEFIETYDKNQKVMDQVQVGNSPTGQPTVAVKWSNENYRFHDWHEYFAETMSDKYFDMKNLQDEKARSIIGHLRQFIQTIKSRIARLFGRDTSGRIYEGFKNQEFDHRQEAEDAYQGTAFMASFGTPPNAANQITQKSFGDNLAKALSSAWTHNDPVMNTLRAGLLGLATGRNVADASEGLFDWTPGTRIATDSKESPNQTFQNAMGHMARRSHTMMDSFRPLMSHVTEYVSKSSPQMNQRFAEAMAHSTRFDYDPSVAPNPKTPPKSAAGIQRLERHREGYAAFKKLDGAGQKLFKDVRDMIHQTRVDAVRQLIRNNIQQVHLNKLRESGSKTPLDYTAINDQTDRYMNRKETDQDKADLGGTHDFIVKARRIINSSENYFPERRHGKYAVVYKDLRPEEHVFHNESDMQDFAKNTDLYIKSSKRTDYDANGKVIEKDDPQAQPVARSEWAVHTQNNGLEFFDSVKDGERRIKELQNHPTNKYDVSAVEHTKENMRVAHSLSPAMLDTLRSALNKTALTDADKESYRQALNEAVIRLLPPNSMRAGQLRRQNYMGASKDITRTLYEHFTSAANIQAKLEHSFEADNALQAMRDHVDAQRFMAGSKNNNHLRQQFLNIFEKMRSSSPLDEPPNQNALKAVRIAQQIAFVRYMATPSFNFIQAAQPYMTGMPYLASRYGHGVTQLEMGKALMRIGGRDILKEGGKQVYSAMHNWITTDLRSPGSYLDIVEQALHRNATTPAEKAKAVEHAALLRRLADDNIVDHGAGLQMAQVMNARETNPFMRGLHAAEEAARAMPTAVEVLNRAMLGIATHELEMRRSNDPEKAYIAARQTIENTQGNYSPSNAPVLFRGSRHPYLVPLFTFRKYAQMIYSLLGRHFYQSLAGETKEVRQVARRTMANTIMMHVLVAGSHGLPVGAIITAMAIGSLALGEDQPWSYDEWSHRLLHEIGLNPKEIDAFVNGLPTLLGANVTKRMGIDSLLLSDLPRTNKWSDWMSTAADTILGAPGEQMAMIPNMMHDIQHGNYVGAASQVLPKIIYDPLKAANFYEHGLQDNYGNTMVGKLPINQIIAQALGFEPDAVEETYGAREVGVNAKDQYRQARAQALDGFKNAYSRSNMAGAMAALNKFNATVPRGSWITFSQALKATRPKRGTQQIDGIGFDKKQQFLDQPMSYYNVPN